MRQILLLVLTAQLSCTLSDASSDADDDDEDTTAFEVEGELESSSCGDGSLALADTVSLTVELTIEGHDVTWDDGDVSADGDLDDDDISFEVERSLTVDMREEGSTLPPCSIVRTDTISGALESAASPDGFDATWRVRYAAADGSDCSDLLEGEARVVEALPCSVRYDLAATVESD